MRFKLPLTVLLCIISSCSKPYKADFIEVVRDHRQITIETLNSVKNTIMDESANAHLNDDQQKGVKTLLDRLDFIIDGSIVIDKYVNSTIDQNTLAELIRNQWDKDK